MDQGFDGFAFSQDSPVYSRILLSRRIRRDDVRGGIEALDLAGVGRS